MTLNFGPWSTEFDSAFDIDLTFDIKSEHFVTRNATINFDLLKTSIGKLTFDLWP